MGQLHPTLLRQQGVNPTVSQTHGGSDGVRCKERDGLNRGEPSISEPRQDCGDVVGWFRNGQIGGGGERWWATRKEQEARRPSAVGNADSSGEVDAWEQSFRNIPSLLLRDGAYKSPALRPDLRKTGNWRSVMSSILKSGLELVEKIGRVILPSVSVCK